MSLVPLLLVSSLLHLYVGWRVWPELPGGPWIGGLFLTLLVASAALLPMGLLARRIRVQPWSDRLAWAGLLAMGLFSSLFVLTVTRDLTLLVLAAFDAVAPGRVPLPGLLNWSAAAVPLGALAFTARGFFNARRTARVVCIDVPISGLPPALHGFTIAQISDIHVGPTIKRPYLQRIVASVNRIDADMVAVTGDLVDGSVSELSEHVAALAALRSTHGTFFVTGNHEYYSGAAAWVAELRRLGLRVLLNEHVVLQHGGSPLLIAGVTDFGAHHFDPAQRSDPRKALAGAPGAAAVRVLLAH
ncbi:MAG: metallophosphoesterase, partial [Pseudomonadota bacterium]|nr:metallophosphoesterase [Pseudomonadota bacterium]